MPNKPIIYQSKHRIKFSELDPYKHMNTGEYATYYADHRMQCLQDYLGWDLQALETMPFMVWIRKMEIDFLRPAQGTNEITITSFVREFVGSDAVIDCTMLNAAGKKLSKCLMTVAHVDKATNRATVWPSERIALFYEKEST